MNVLSARRAVRLAVVLTLVLKFFAEAQWTQWYDRDNGGGTGDWERIQDFPGDFRPCGGRKTLKIHAREKGTNGIGIKTRDHLIVGPKYGLLCSNGVVGGLCRDYGVRYNGWPFNSGWKDVDDPGFSDNERIEEHDGVPPIQYTIQYRVQGVPFLVYTVPQKITLGPRFGLMCKNSEQNPGETCKDYEVRYLCGGYPKLGRKASN